MGGEKFVDESHFYKNLGSPPRWRGKDLHELHGVLLAGITPAWAGKRAFFFLRMLLFWDHPRMGGEKSRLQSLAERRVGSPPRWRGKGQAPAGPLAAGRITPA